MSLPEAIVYCLITSNRGMRTEQLAEMINFDFSTVHFGHFSGGATADKDN
ncbi:MAG: hypothetical protein MJZ94_05575 [Bacteroidales bacterium]|nr:hypothetical protein [Bacteroidales bacterium]